ncbi:MAG: hypothetical protein NT116_03635 [Candidatus Parcubacteria bacterium]|nr:hypothetical protein [Candidatus Parcubacteria bacterium]
MSFHQSQTSQFQKRRNYDDKKRDYLLPSGTHISNDWHPNYGVGNTNGDKKNSERRKKEHLKKQLKNQKGLLKVIPF